MLLGGEFAEFPRITWRDTCGKTPGRKPGQGHRDLQIAVPREFRGDLSREQSAVGVT
jgi:hypothetical protein